MAPVPPRPARPTCPVRTTRPNRRRRRGVSQAIEPIGSGYEWDPSQDVDYIAGLTTELLNRYRPPSGRVVLTGMSGGARMSSSFRQRSP